MREERLTVMEDAMKRATRRGIGAQRRPAHPLSLQHCLPNGILPGDTFSYGNGAYKHRDLEDYENEGLSLLCMNVAVPRSEPISRSALSTTVVKRHTPQELATPGLRPRVECTFVGMVAAQ